MQSLNNIIEFPSLIDKKKKKLVTIRDEIEEMLTRYALDQQDIWAVSLAAGRFASINLEKIDGEEHTIDFFKSCMNTQKKFELSRSRNSSDIS
jgi:hypothetical protein